MADTTNKTIRIHREAGMASAADRIRVEHKTKKYNINGTQTRTTKNNATTAKIITAPIIYNRAQQKTKSAQNALSDGTSRKFAFPRTLIIWETNTTSNKKK